MHKLIFLFFIFLAGNNNLLFSQNITTYQFVRIDTLRTQHKHTLSHDGKYYYTMEKNTICKYYLADGNLKNKVVLNLKKKYNKELRLVPSNHGLLVIVCYVSEAEIKFEAFLYNESLVLQTTKKAVGRGVALEMRDYTYGFVRNDSLYLSYHYNNNDVIANGQLVSYHLPILDFTTQQFYAYEFHKNLIKNIIEVNNLANNSFISFIDVRSKHILFQLYHPYSNKHTSYIYNVSTKKLMMFKDFNIVINPFLYGLWDNICDSDSNFCGTVLYYID
jgi:hypothetical protein